MPLRPKPPSSFVGSGVAFLHNLLFSTREKKNSKTSNKQLTEIMPTGSATMEGTAAAGGVAENRRRRKGQWDMLVINSARELLCGERRKNTAAV